MLFYAKLAENLGIDLKAFGAQKFAKAVTSAMTETDLKLTIFKIGKGVG